MNARSPHGGPAASSRRGGSVDGRDVILARLAISAPAVAVPRHYRVSAEGDLVELFIDRLRDYRAHVHDALSDALEGVRRLVVPREVPAAWLEGFGGTVIRDDGLTFDELDEADAVLTGCTVAIAQTGTIILDAGPAQGRRAITLIPDRHIVVVGKAQIVGTVPQAVRLLDARRPQTWISGPSATSDIELHRVEGVHGPRRLDVVLQD